MIQVTKEAQSLPNTNLSNYRQTTSVMTLSKAQESVYNLTGTVTIKFNQKIKLNDRILFQKALKSQNQLTSLKRLICWSRVSQLFKTSMRRSKCNEITCLSKIRKFICSAKPILRKWEAIRFMNKCLKMNEV